MRCEYCQGSAGWFKRLCADCGRLHDIFTEHQGQLGLLQFLDLFIETGLSRTKIEAFMNADPHGRGSVKDRITADMSRELLGAMGIRTEQTARDVRELREKGTWQGMDEKPDE